MLCSQSKDLPCSFVAGYCQRCGKSLRVAAASEHAAEAHVASLEASLVRVTAERDEALRQRNNAQLDRDVAESRKSDAFRELRERADAAEKRMEELREAGEALSRRQGRVRVGYMIPCVSPEMADDWDRFRAALARTKPKEGT